MRLYRFNGDDGARKAYVDTSSTGRTKRFIDHGRVALDRDGSVTARVDAYTATGTEVLVYINHALSHLYANCTYI